VCWGCWSWAQPKGFLEAGPWALSMGTDPQVSHRGRPEADLEEGVMMWRGLGGQAVSSSSDHWLVGRNWGRFEAFAAADLGTGLVSARAG
jgi:hypothetical protein